MDFSFIDLLLKYNHHKLGRLFFEFLDDLNAMGEFE
jgi:hypothetical protein